MLAREFRRFLDIFHRKNFAGEIRFDDVLKTGNFRMIEKTTARADIRINVSRVRRVLPPVREFVAVRIQNRIESQRLNGFLPGANAGGGTIYAQLAGLAGALASRELQNYLLGAPERRSIIAVVPE
jgi:hypothetical protein